MTNEELVRRLAAKLDLTLRETGEHLRSTVGLMATRLGEGEGFTIPRLGTFKIKNRGERTMYNPHYKTRIKIPPKRVIHFTPGKSLREEMQNVDPDHE